ncbi:MAG: HAD-IIIA family hydrolase [Anaerolineae bacterium]|nr:HAD-IIIA family hydrolase [Anaerolineae bacterium]
MMAKSTGDYLRHYMGAVSEVLRELPWEAVEQVVDTLHEARLCRANVFLCGNGGSAATAAHFVNDLNKGANAQGVPRFRAVGLGDNVPLLTAWSNDLHYAEAFAESLRNLARPGDVLIAISCSGNSANVLRAVELARGMGLVTIGLTGMPGGKLAQLVDLAVRVPASSVEQVEDVHMVLEHAIVSALRHRAEQELVPSLLLADGRGATPKSGVVAPELPMRPAIFLDRDGVINANRVDHVKSWQELEVLPGALEALRMLARTFLPIIVVTNQAGVNRQAMTFEMAESINRRLLALVRAHGGRIDAVVWCPHRPEEECGCRKPKPGMLTYAAETLHLDLARSFLVGDSADDVAAGLAAGCQVALVLTGRGAAQRPRVEERWGERCRILPDLMAAAEWILQEIEDSELEHLDS